MGGRRRAPPDADVHLEALDGEVEERALGLRGEGADIGEAIGEEAEFEVEVLDEAAPLAMFA